MRVFFQKGFIANIIGAILDKSLPLIIAIFLTNYMSKENFGYWVQYFQILLVVSSSIMSPVQLFFRRGFSKQTEKRLKLLNSPFIIGVFVVVYFVFLLFFKELTAHSSIIEMVLLIFMFIIYGLNATYLRFQKKEIKYTSFALLRLFLFTATITYFIYNGIEINFNKLVTAFFFAHIPYVFNLFNNIEINLNIDISSLKEYFRLFIYGLTTSLLSGVDKLILIRAGYSYEDLSFYAYAIAFAGLPSFLIEAVKQFMGPKLYHDLDHYKDYSKKTVSLLIKFIIFLIIIQFLLPILMFEMFKCFNILNLEYIRSNDFYSVLTIFNIGFSLHIVYHFLNPYMFYFDRSFYLLTLQIISIFIYTVLLFTTDVLTDDLLAIYRGLMFLILIIGVVVPLVNKKLKKKYVFR